VDYFDVIQKRHSVRSYRPDPVEPEKLAQILEAARLAPTAVNYQPFKIIVIETKGREEELKKVYHRDWFSQAPLILGVCVITDKCWVRNDNKRFGDVDAAIVMDHLILAATALELGTCWVGAFKLKVAKEVLNIDDNLEPVAFTPLGYPADATFKKVRKSLEELVIYR
jgi:nitroreductase